MQREWNNKISLKAMNREWWSKLTDGVLAASILFLTWFVIILSIRPIEQVLGLPGLLIYALCLLAISMFSLQQSILYRHPDIVRAWYGIAGGFLAWTVAIVSKRFGLSLFPTFSSMILMIMLSLIVALLWRSVLPSGVRFFSLTFLLNWAEYSVISMQAWLSTFSPVFELAYRATGYLAIAAAVLTLGWILFKTRQRLERIMGAVTLWFMVSLALYVFYGSLFQ